MKRSDERYSARLFNPSCPQGNPEPSRLGELVCARECGHLDQRRRGDALNGVTLVTRNLQLGKPAGDRAAHRDGERNLATECVGAIAVKGSIATYRNDGNRVAC